MTAVDVRRFADLDAASRAAAAELVVVARDAIAARGVCHLALAGGSTPRALFRALVALGRDALAWDRVELWWGDERTVGPDHPDSNYRMAREALLVPLAIAAERVHRMPGELADPDAAARAYEAALVTATGTPPVIDLILLGLGPDGHTASLFPTSPALIARDRWVVANLVTSPLVRGTTTRLTMTAAAINAARHVRFVVAGADKAAALAAILDGPRAPATYPAQLISPAPGDLAWFVDDAAAAHLPPNPKDPR